MQTEQSIAELEEIIRSEQRLEALKSHGEAWATGFVQGIDPDILADTAIYTAFHEVIRSRGEKAALALVEKLKDRIACGEFEPERLCH
jgi:hypothetical protein